jgi:hypothetical protein
MTTVAHGPYEHVGAYADLAESERFDTSGMPESFCPLCEHDPCIAALRKVSRPKRCAEAPRQQAVSRVTEAIHSAGRSLTGRALKVYEATSLAVYNLAAIAVIDPNPYTRSAALDYLVKIRDDMCRAVAR